jgi:hypothetical protein
MSAPVTHVDADALAEFRAGLVTGRRGARIAAHLAGCDRCAALDSELAGVSALLASVPAPVLPDRVAQRLDAALAAEVARRDDPERAGREPSPEPAAPSRRARHRGFRLPSLRVLVPAAAAAAVVLAGGGYGLSLIARGPGSQATASAGSAASAQSNAAKPVAGAAEPTGRAAAPLASAPPHSGASARSELMSPANFTVVASDTDFTKATLDQDLAAELRVSPAAGTQHTPSTQVRGCVQHVADGAGLVRVLSARYEGHPATVIVTSTGHGEEAWVAGPDCSGTNRDVLFHTSLPPGI